MKKLDDLSWAMFEMSGSIESYLNYKACKEFKDKQKLEKGDNVGDGGNRGDNNQRS